MSEFSIGIIADWLRLPFEESLKTCADMGADGVQLYAVSGEMAPENLTPAQIAEKKALLSRYGLAVSALCGDLGGHGFTRADENPGKIEKSKRIVDLALELGSHVVTTHIGVVPEDNTCDTYKSCKRPATPWRTMHIGTVRSSPSRPGRNRPRG